MAKTIQKGNVTSIFSKGTIVDVIMHADKIEIIVNNQSFFLPMDTIIDKIVKGK